MVAPKQRFPLVRWAVLVCSFDDLRNSGACSPCHTKELKGLKLLAGQLEGKLKLKMNPDLVVSSAPSHLVFFKYRLYLAELFIAGAVVN
jgi:hypothetical protein